MTFWIRHLTLLILCVVVPLGASIYFDTQSEIGRAQIAGSKAAKLGERSLSQRLQLDAHNLVGDALNLARQVSEQQILDDLSKSGRKKEIALASIQELGGKAGEGRTFVWLIDPEGRLIWRTGAPDLDANPRSIAGHPLFVKTQLGLAFDAFWDEDGLALVGAAPVTTEGSASGAVVIGNKIDRGFLDKLAGSLGVNLTVVSRDALVATTLDDTFAKGVIDSTRASVEPVFGGRLDQPLRSGTIPALPILVDKHADGLAFTSLVHTGPAGAVRWIVSVPSADSLQELWQRQEILLGVLFVSLMLAVLVGMLNYRTFVTPIEKVAEHLSNIQLGRGEVELAETAVSSPFRRLVKLVNMTVQKMPTRSFPSVSLSGESSPISELPSMAKDTGDLVLESGAFKAPPRKIEPAPPPADISMFPPAPSKVGPPAKKPAPIDDEASAVEEAIASMSLKPMSAQAIDQDDGQDDSAEAIAEAIASLEAQQRAAADAGLSAPPQPRSASGIRGAKPSGESPFMPSQSEYFRAGSLTGGEPSAADESFMPPPSAVARGGGLRSGGSLSAPAGLGSATPAQHSEFSPESTVVAPVQKDLLARSARDDLSGEHSAIEDAKPDATVVASVPADLLAQTAGEAVPDGPGPDPHGLDASDHAHFKQVYERFVDMRRKCGEGTSDLAFDRFLTKLTKNREALIKKYNCRTVRFQVYEKDGKAALKATPVRAR